MSEYLYEMMMSVEDNLTDEERFYVMARTRCSANRKKNYQKELENNGKESNYDFYC